MSEYNAKAVINAAISEGNQLIAQMERDKEQRKDKLTLSKATAKGLIEDLKEFQKTPQGEPLIYSPLNFDNGSIHIGVNINYDNRNPKDPYKSAFIIVDGEHITAHIGTEEKPRAIPTTQDGVGIVEPASITPDMVPVSMSNSQTLEQGSILTPANVDSISERAAALHKIVLATITQGYTRQR